MYIIWDTLIPTTQKILPLRILPQHLTAWKSTQKRLVFTNGCFDILHLGHVDYLEKAKVLGDILMIGLNSDASVQRLKGTTRPINTVYARARLLAALACVDAVVIFQEDTPEVLIQQVQPDVLVKGGDYQWQDIVGAAWVRRNGGIVKTIPLVEGFSTTHLCHRIKLL